jgi:hypothetical protein
MDTSDKPLLPVVFKFEEAFNVIKGMLAENSIRQDQVRNLPADVREQANQSLARDREQILLLASMLQGLAAAMIDTIRAESYEPVALKLREANGLARTMPAECSKRSET